MEEPSRVRPTHLTKQDKPTAKKAKSQPGSSRRHHRDTRFNSQILLCNRFASDPPGLRLRQRGGDHARRVVERGRVPDLKGLSVKAAIHRVVLVGGAPRVESSPGITATRVLGQSPEPGAPLEPGTVVKIKAGMP